jgi:pimeloyl-ACP methyl ester carboxylesterase
MNKQIDFINVDGIKLECLRINTGASGERPTLIFLHEGLGCVALWRDFPRNICKKMGLNGFVYSRQGYGASDPIPLPRPINFMHHEALEVVSRVIDAAGISSAILIGHSDGGSISLIHGGGVKDPRVKSILTIAAHVINEELTVKSIEEAKVAYETTNLRNRLKKYHGKNVDCAFWGWNDVWLNPSFWHWNIGEYLPRIDVPTLIIQGSEDQYGTAAQVKTIEAGLLCVTQTVMIESAQHSPHLEEQDLTITAIKAFCENNLEI